MRNGFILILSHLIFFLVAPTLTWAISLDFESGCGSTPAPAGCKEIISTPTFSPDVLFSKSSNGVNVVSQLGAPAPPFSPSRSARWDPDQLLPDDPYRTDFIISGVNMVSVVLGDSGADADELFLKVFDKNGNVIGSDSKTLSANTAGGFVLSVSAPEIAFAEFGRMIGQAGEGNSVQFDNFTYTTASAPIPEPATVFLVATGLLGMTFWRIRTAKKTH